MYSCTIVVIVNFSMLIKCENGVVLFTSFKMCSFHRVVECWMHLKCIPNASENKINSLNCCDTDHVYQPKHRHSITFMIYRMFLWGISHFYCQFWHTQGMQTHNESHKSWHCPTGILGFFLRRNNNVTLIRVNMSQYFLVLDWKKCTS